MPFNIQGDVPARFSGLSPVQEAERISSRIFEKTKRLKKLVTFEFLNFNNFNNLNFNKR